MSSMAGFSHTAHFVVNRKRQFGEARLSIKRGRNKSSFCCDLFFYATFWPIFNDVALVCTSCGTTGVLTSCWQVKRDFHRRFVAL